MWIHLSPVDSHNKGAVMQKVFPCQYNQLPSQAAFTMKVHDVQSYPSVCSMEHYLWLTHPVNGDKWLRHQLLATCHHQGVVSLTFRELSKIISRKYTLPVIKFLVRVSSWNFVRVPKAWLWARTKFQFEMLIGSAISATHKFRDNILESSRNVSETTPGSILLKSVTCHLNFMEIMLSYNIFLKRLITMHFVRAMTAQLSWYVQKCVVIISLKFKLKQYEIFIKFAMIVNTDQWNMSHVLNTWCWDGETCNKIKILLSGSVTSISLGQDSGDIFDDNFKSKLLYEYTWNMKEFQYPSS